MNHAAAAWMDQACSLGEVKTSTDDRMALMASNGTLNVPGSLRAFGTGCGRSNSWTLESTFALGTRFRIYPRYQIGGVVRMSHSRSRYFGPMRSDRIKVADISSFDAP